MRSPHRVALAAYLGGSTKFDEALASLAETYGDQNERDYAAHQTAVKEGQGGSHHRDLPPGSACAVQR